MEEENYDEELGEDPVDYEGEGEYDENEGECDETGGDIENEDETGGHVGDETGGDIENDEDEGDSADGGCYDDRPPEPIDQQAEKRIIQSAADFAISKGYLVSFDISSEIQWTFRVFFKVDDMDEDLLAACGIDKEKWIYVQFIFKGNPPSYLSTLPLLEKKEFEIKQTTSTNLNGHKLDSFEFGLGYTLQQRLKTWLDQSFSSYSLAKKNAFESVYKWLESENIPNAEAVLAALSLPPEDLEIAKAALESCNNDISRAITFLLEHEDRETFENTIRTATQDKKPFKVPQDPFFVDVVTFLRTYVASAPKYCLCCGSEQPMELLKPVSCDRDLCQFQQIALGLGVSLEAELVHRPASVDLLICMTVSSATENRHFIPFPAVQVTRTVTGGDRLTLTFDNTKPQEVVDLLQECPPVETLKEWVQEGRLQEKCGTISPLLYPLLRWIVATSRAHLKELDQGLKVDTPHQFILKATTPEKEQIFQTAKTAHGGSFFAWHGSPLGNWHSILRMGLKNYSDTVHQRNGRAYGPGIYLAVSSGTSMGYAAGYGSWKNSKFGSQLKCVALCEVIDHGNTETCLGRVHRPNCSHVKNAPFYRVEAEEFVITRFLFIYSGKNTLNKNAEELAPEVAGNRDYLKMAKKIDG